MVFNYRKKCSQKDTFIVKPVNKVTFKIVNETIPEDR